MTQNLVPILLPKQINHIPKVGEMYARRTSNPRNAYEICVIKEVTVFHGSLNKQVNINYTYYHISEGGFTESTFMPLDSFISKRWRPVADSNADSPWPFNAGVFGTVKGTLLKNIHGQINQYSINDECTSETMINLVSIGGLVSYLRDIDLSYCDCEDTTSRKALLDDKVFAEYIKDKVKLFNKEKPRMEVRYGFTFLGMRNADLYNSTYSNYCTYYLTINNRKKEDMKMLNKDFNSCNCPSCTGEHNGMLLRNTIPMGLKFRNAKKPKASLQNYSFLLEDEDIRDNVIRACCNYSFIALRYSFHNSHWMLYTVVQNLISTNQNENALMFSSGQYTFPFKGITPTLDAENKKAIMIRVIPSFSREVSNAEQREGSRREQGSQQAEGNQEKKSSIYSPQKMLFSLVDYTELHLDAARADKNMFGVRYPLCKGLDTMIGYDKNGEPKIFLVSSKGFLAIDRTFDDISIIGRNVRTKECTYRLESGDNKYRLRIPNGVKTTTMKLGINKIHVLKSIVVSPTSGGGRHHFLATPISAKNFYKVFPNTRFWNLEVKEATEYAKNITTIVKKRHLQRELNTLDELIVNELEKVITLEKDGLIKLKQREKALNNTSGLLTDYIVAMKFVRPMTQYFNWLLESNAIDWSEYRIDLTRIAVCKAEWEKFIQIVYGKLGPAIKDPDSSISCYPVVKKIVYWFMEYLSNTSFWKSFDITKNTTTVLARRLMKLVNSSLIDYINKNMTTTSDGTGTLTHVLEGRKPYYNKEQRDTLRVTLHDGLVRAIDSSLPLTGELRNMLSGMKAGSKRDMLLTLRGQKKPIESNIQFSENIIKMTKGTGLTDKLLTKLKQYMEQEKMSLRIDTKNKGNTIDGLQFAGSTTAFSIYIRKWVNTIEYIGDRRKWSKSLKYKFLSYWLPVPFDMTLHIVPFSNLNGDSERRNYYPLTVSNISISVRTINNLTSLSTGIVGSTGVHPFLNFRGNSHFSEGIHNRSLVEGRRIYRKKNIDKGYLKFCYGNEGFELSKQLSSGSYMQFIQMINSLIGTYVEGCSPHFGLSRMDRYTDKMKPEDEDDNIPITRLLIPGT